MEPGRRVINTRVCGVTLIIGVAVVLGVACALVGRTGSVHTAGELQLLRDKPAEIRMDIVLEPFDLKHAPKTLPIDIVTANAETDQFLARRTSESGLVASFADTSPYSFSVSGGKGRFFERQYGKLGYLDDQAYTYDLSLVVIGHLLLGNRAQAEAILGALEKEFYLPKNGTYGLFNGYLVTSQIPLNDLELGMDGDRIHAGPTLWVALAALNHTRLERNTRYLAFALDVVHWCRTELTYYRFPDGERGAISMGSGWGPDWSTIFATEHNVDYYAVLKILHEIYMESPDEVRAIYRKKKIDPAWLEDEMAHLGRWLREVAFDREHYCWRAGYNMFGIDPTRVVDGTSWGIGGVGPEAFESWGIDVDRLMESTEKMFLASYRLPDGRTLYGFDITDPEGYQRRRRPLVWFEATGQMCIAYGRVAKFYEKKGNRELAWKYKAKAYLYLSYMNQFKEYYHLKQCLPYMSVSPSQKEILKTMKDEWEIPRARHEGQWVGSVSSTMWFLYCAHNLYNPMTWESGGK